MKKIFSILLAISMLVCMLCLFTGCGEDVLYVYNWGEYISDGSEDSFDTIREFEAWYKETYGKKIKVKYDTFASCEDMYNKIASGAVSYDVIIPSDYMIARMANEGLLEELNFENIPNYQYIDDTFKGLYYDPENLYSVPYAYGIVGVIYDANKVDAADVADENWDLLWNEKYSGRILQFGNPRDAFGTAMYKLGIDVNTSDRSEWDRAKEELLNQRSILYGQVMDEIFDKMESGEAAIGAYYAGDYFTMVDAQADDVDLQFYYPERTNYYVDAMCIPTCAKNKELAEIFINYMLSEEPAIANAEFTYYASPNSLVYNNESYLEEMGEEAIAVLYPPMDDFAATYNEVAYRNLDNDMLDYLNSLWEDVKIN